MAGDKTVTYRFVLDQGDFQRGLSSAQRALTAFVEGIGQGIGQRALSALEGIPAALSSMASKVLEQSGHLSDMAAKTGLSTTALQELQHAGMLVGVSLDSVTAATSKMQKGLVEGNTAFERLGLSSAKLRSEGPQQALADVAAAIQRIPDPAGQAAAAMEIFGKSGAELLPLLKSDISAAADEAQRLGLVLSAETVAGADKLGDSIDTLKATFNALQMQVGGLIATNPAVHAFVTGVTTLFANLGKLLLANRDAMQALITEGVLFMVNGFVSAADAAVQLSDVIGSMQLLWIGLKAATVDAAIAFVKSASAMQLFKTDKMKAEYDSILGTLEHIRIADGNEANAAEAAATKRANALSLVRAEFAKLASDVEKASKTTIDFTTASKTSGDAINFVGAAAAAQSAKIADLQAKVHAYAASLQKPQDLGNDSLFKLTLQEVATYASEVAHIIPVTIDWQEALQGVGDAFAQLGQMAGGVLGGIFSAIGRLIPLIQSMGKSLGGNISGAVGIGGVVGGLAGGGAGIGAGIGALGASTILPMIGSVLGPIGTIGGALIGGVLGKVFGGLFGGKKEPQIIPPTWEEKFKAAQSAVEQFGLGAGKAIGALLGTAGNRRPEAQAFVNEQLGKAASALPAIGGLDITSPASAAAQATIFTTTFWALVKEQGLVKGVEALSAPFAALKDKLAAGGFDVNALLGGVGGLFDAVEGPAKAALEAADGLNQALQGIAMAGYLTQDSFNAFGTSAQDAFKQATDGGLSDQQALLAIAPLLGSIQQAHETYGLTIDANTQALLDQAKAAGVAFPTTPMDRAAAAIEKLVKLLGGDLVDAADAAASHINGIGNVHPTVPPPNQQTEGYATGGYIPPTSGGRVIRVAEGGEGEYVVPRSAAASFARSLGGGGLSIQIGSIVVSGAADAGRQVVEAVKTAIRANQGGLVSEMKLKLQGA